MKKIKIGKKILNLFLDVKKTKKEITTANITKKSFVRRPINNKHTRINSKFLHDEYIFFTMKQKIHIETNKASESFVILKKL